MKLLTFSYVSLVNFWHLMALVLRICETLEKQVFILIK